LQSALTRSHSYHGQVTWVPGVQGPALSLPNGILDFVGVLRGVRFVAFDVKGTQNAYSR